MEANVKRREWVKTAAIIFLAILLVLTFFSNTIMNASLPEVAAQQVSSGAINAKIRGSGTIAANETYDVTISQTRKIASVKVKVGQTVNAGDVLFTLEAAESDELKQAQDALESLERAYEKALLSASTSDAQENREVEKARAAYNEALVIYRQYSTMDPANLASAQAEADAQLKQLQRQLKQVQKDLTDAQSDRDYTDAQAQVTELTGKISGYESEIESLQTQLEDFDNGQSQQQSLQRQIQDKQSELSAAQAVYESDKVFNEYYYNLLMEVAGQDKTVAAALANDINELTNRLANHPDTGSEENAAALAKECSASYALLSGDQEKIEALTLELSRLQEDLRNAADSTEGSRDKIVAKLNEAQQNLTQSERKLASAEDAVKRFEAAIERLQDQADAVSDNVDDQQAEVDKLASAASAADTVKSAKQALEDLVFAQSLGDTASLDLKDQKEDIEKQKLAIEELTKNADGQEVTAKVSGIVSEISVTAGNTAGAETPLCTINVADRGYTIKIPVTQDQARRVKVGDNAELVNYWGGNVTATLESVANDPENPGKGKLLIFRLSGEVDPGTNLTLSIGQKSANYDALVPNSAIRTDNNGSFVLALVAKSTPLSTRYTATRVDVQELAKDDNYTAVSGIGAGEFVITTSTKPIEAGTQVRLVDEP